MIGTLVADDKGYVIETLDTDYNEPFLQISKWRVVVMDGRPESARESVRSSSASPCVYVGHGFQATIENVPPESMSRTPIKKPRGMKVWRNGEWRRK